MNKSKVIIGMSGGVDSSVAAYLLKEQGYQVIGVTLKLFETYGKFAENDYIEKAKQIANKLNIQHIVVDVRETFKDQIINNFVDEYLKAKTPSPCTVCNKIIKHKTLIDIANQHKAYYIATGHYITIIKENDKYYIFKGKDKIKDQSYFLWNLTGEMLSRTLSPLGKYTKSEVKQIAEKLNFADLYNKKESMGVCFLQKTNYRDFINANYPEKVKTITKGNVYNEKNELIGQHAGLYNYTIGQKNGIDYFSKQKNLYVKEMNFEKNSIIVTEKNKLNTKELYIDNYNFIDINDLKSDKIKVKIRGYGLNPDKHCKIESINNTIIKISLNDVAWAPAPGQPIVLYKGNKLLGGGITIDSAKNNISNCL